MVFSDEFLGYQRNTLGSITDKRWTAMDYHYSSNKNEWQNYKPEYVEVKDGKLLLTLDDKPSSGRTQKYLLLLYAQIPHLTIADRPCI